MRERVADVIDKTGKSSKCTVRGSAAKGGNRKSISGKTCYFAGR